MVHSFESLSLSFFPLFSSSRPVKFSPCTALVINPMKHKARQRGSVYSFPQHIIYHINHRPGPSGHSGLLLCPGLSSNLTIPLSAIYSVKTKIPRRLEPLSLYTEDSFKKDKSNAHVSPYQLIIREEHKLLDINMHDKWSQCIQLTQINCM